MPAPETETPSVTRLEIVPGELTLAKGESGKFQIRAHWSDGVVQDATRWTLTETSNDRIAALGASGEVLARGPGRTAIIIRYQGHGAALPVTIPFGPKPTLDYPGNNWIDTLIATEWTKLGLKPTALSTDAEFLRRVSLDLIGTLPTPDEVRRFLASSDPKKRAKLIDELLERSEYVDYWSLKWADLLRAHRRALGEKGLATFQGWLKQSLRENKPADHIVRELLTAQGNLFSSGPVAFAFVDKTPDDLAETSAQIFLGIRLQCAKCHHHPFEVWSQDDYQGMAAFFARVQRKDSGENGQFGGVQSLRIAPTGSYVHFRTGKAVAPRALGQAAQSLDDPRDPRIALADWVTRKDNPYFSRNITNRYWAYLFGRGLVDPADDLRATQPAIYPTLLDALAKDWATHDFDLKDLLRTIANSRAYQLAVDLTPERDTDGAFFTHCRPRRLPAEVFLDAINASTLAVENFEKFPPGTRAIALPDPSILSYFLDIFGRPKRTSTCECERVGNPDLGQTLHLANGEALHRKVVSDQSRVATLLAKKQTVDAIIEELYLATLSRSPTRKEIEAVRVRMAEAPTPREGLEDLHWALLNSAEFAFQH